MTEPGESLSACLSSTQKRTSTRIYLTNYHSLCLDLPFFLFQNISECQKLFKIRLPFKTKEYNNNIWREAPPVIWAELLKGWISLTLQAAISSLRNDGRFFKNNAWISKGKKTCKPQNSNSTQSKNMG